MSSSSGGLFTMTSRDERLDIAKMESAIGGLGFCEVPCDAIRGLTQQIPEMLDQRFAYRQLRSLDLDALLKNATRRSSASGRW
ncbi:MAG: hypothetical protein ABIP94_03470 [Planctomycetota bacterium]